MSYLIRREIKLTNDYLKLSVTVVEKCYNGDQNFVDELVMYLRRTLLNLDLISQCQLG